MRWFGGWVILLAGLGGVSPVDADTHEESAQQRLEAMSCGEVTVGKRLAEAARAHAQRDLGWRFFREGEDLDVERAFRLTKSMEIRYRWRVTHAGGIVAISDHARTLCSEAG